MEALRDPALTQAVCRMQPSCRKRGTISGAVAAALGPIQAKFKGGHADLMTIAQEAAALRAQAVDSASGTRLQAEAAFSLEEKAA